jgi:hypothetical protein
MTYTDEPPLNMTEDEKEVYDLIHRHLFFNRTMYNVKVQIRFERKTCILPKKWYERDNPRKMYEEENDGQQEFYDEEENDGQYEFYDCKDEEENDGQQEFYGYIEYEENDGKQEIQAEYTIQYDSDGDYYYRIVLIEKKDPHADGCVWVIMNGFNKNENGELIEDNILSHQYYERLYEYYEATPEYECILNMFS